jgi:hypothetical protein
MRLLGESAAGGRVLVQEMQAASDEGRPFFCWCDGQDLTAVIGDEGDTPADVLRMASNVVQEVS